MSKTHQITGLWKSQNGNLRFKMNDKVKEAIASCPDGVYPIILNTKEKKTENSPDANLVWFEDEPTADDAPF